MAGFRAAAEEFERVHGKMSNDELRQFKAEWKQANGGQQAGSGSRPAGKPSKSPQDANAYVREAYTDAGKNVAGAGRSIKDWLSKAALSAGETAAPASEEEAEKVETGVHNIGQWLSKVGDRMMPGDAHSRDRKEDALKRAVERMGNKLNELLSGESRFEQLQPEFARKPVRLSPVDLPQGARGSPSNPIELEPVSDDELLNTELPAGHDIEAMPKEVAALRFRKGGRENPLRLDPINLPEDAPDEGLRTGEVVINVPPRDDED
jgi:hypothetical protein